MFNGEFVHSLDDKGRVVLPIKFRYLLGEKFVITKGLHGCLWVFPAEEWNQFDRKLREQSFLDLNAVRLQRFLSASAYEETTDNQNRLTIRANLRDYAAIDGQVVIVGASNRVEIWSRERWEAINANISAEEIAEAAKALGLTKSQDATAEE